MPRPLIERGAASDDGLRQRSIARSTARAFAAAVSALIISTLVVSRSDQALDAEGTTASSTLTAGTILLTDDDDGRSLFDLSAMVPGVPVERCIEVVYEGTILPVDLSLAIDGQGDLLPYLRVSVEEGSGGTFDSCAAFTSEETVFDGGFEQLAARGRTPLAVIVNSGEVNSYRIRFEAADSSEALGLGAGIDVVWEVAP